MIMEVNEILEVKEFNKIQTEKWKRDCDKTLREVGMFNYMHGHQPNLCFYIYDKNDGYVLKTKNGSVWRKTKRELIFKQLNK
tara:strand:- start:384 stop:629 length:246 start_codon:yes stop_codon:yes gene_type:complete